MVILGTIVQDKEQAMKLIARVCRIANTSMEHSVAILELEDRLVKAGMLTWNDCEIAEVM